jgi:two-component system sensor histidine kinase DesK
MHKSQLHETDDAVQATTRSPYLVWLIWVVWLPFVIPPLANLLQSSLPLWHLLPILTGVALFFAIYLLATWQTAQRLVKSSPRTRWTETSIWLITAVLAVLSFVLALSDRTAQWLALFFFTSGYAGGSLRTISALLASTMLAILIVIVSYVMRLNWLILLQAGVFVVAVNFIIISVIRSIKTRWELQAAREEIARLAVTTERLRIARDLHDLLGHNLALIALKAELAGRLLQVAPARAAVEIGDVERVARTTLQQVREAVASYRQPTLVNELHAAQEILAAAGIAYRYEGNEKEQDLLFGELPTAVEAVLAWMVREGVTNVIRHSRARQCTINLRREQHAVGVEIVNNGIYPGDQPVDSAFTCGNGLRGLAERVAALDGHFEAGRQADDDFRLAAMIPLAGKRKRTARGDNERSQEP